MAKLPNGDILCVMRTGSYSPLWQARSRDGGRTWDAPEPMGWPGAKPQLQVLPNGVLACASGRGSYGHPQVTHVMISIDGTGNHWEAPFCFHTGPGCSYTTTMQRDGKLHVIYSDSDFTRDMGTHGLPCSAFAAPSSISRPPPLEQRRLVTSQTGSTHDQPSPLQRRDPQRHHHPRAHRHLGRRHREHRELSGNPGAGTAGSSCPSRARATAREHGHRGGPRPHHRVLRRRRDLATRAGRQPARHA